MFASAWIQYMRPFNLQSFFARTRVADPNVLDPNSEFEKLSSGHGSGLSFYTHFQNTSKVGLSFPFVLGKME